MNLMEDIQDDEYMDDQDDRALYEQYMNNYRFGNTTSFANQVDTSNWKITDFELLETLGPCFLSIFL